MNRLFIQLYLDENVDVRVADIIQGRGFDAVTSREAEQLGRSDEEQLTYAATHSLTLVTHNRIHFERLAQQYVETGRTHAGIIIAVQRPYREVARRLLVLMNKITSDEMRDLILYV